MLFKKCNLAIILLFILGTFLFVGCAQEAKGPNIITPKTGTKLSAEQLLKIKTDIETNYPAAMNRVTGFFGDPKIASKFSNIKILVLDTPSRDAHLCGTWSMQPAPGLPYSIKLHGGKYLTGQCDPEKTIAGLLIGAMLQSHYENGTKWKNGDLQTLLSLSYYGSGLSDQYLARELNTALPSFDVKKIFDDKHRKNFVRQAGLGYCFQTTYGQAGLMSLLKGLLHGKDPSKALTDASGKDLKATNSDINECLKKDLDKKIKAAGPYIDVWHDFYEKKWSGVLKKGKALFADKPNSIYQNHYAFTSGNALLRKKKFKDAIAPLEEIRTGKYGASHLYDEAASGIVWALLETKQCDQAVKTHELFQALYPRTKYRFTSKWDAKYEENCGKK